MTINERIISALSDIAPTTPDIKDTSTTGDYITFNYSYESPDMYADDEIQTETASLQVHYFTTGNPIPNKKAIKKALRNAEFTVTGTTQQYETDTKLYHVVVEIEITERVD